MSGFIGQPGRPQLGSPGRVQPGQPGVVQFPQHAAFKVDGAPGSVVGGSSYWRQNYELRNGQLPPGSTFTRLAGTGFLADTYIDQNGFMRGCGTPANVPRFTFDIRTRTLLGLSMQQGQNQLFNFVQAGTGDTIGASTLVDPANFASEGISPLLVDETLASIGAVWKCRIPSSGSSVNCVAFPAQGGAAASSFYQSGLYVWIPAATSGSGGFSSGGLSAAVDTTGTALTVAQTGAANLATPERGIWQPVWMSFQTGATAGNLTLRLAANSAVAGDVFYWTLPMLQKLTAASSDLQNWSIIGGGGLNDLLTVPTPSGLSGATRLTMMVETMRPPTQFPSGTGVSFTQITDGTTSNRIRIYPSAGTGLGAFRTQAQVGGAGIWNSAAYTPIYRNNLMPVTRIGITMDSAVGFIISCNGSTVLNTPGTFTFPTGLNTVNFGGQTGAQQSGVILRRLLLLGTMLSEGDLNSLTYA